MIWMHEIRVLIWDADWSNFSIETVALISQLREAASLNFRLLIFAVMIKINLKPPFRNECVQHQLLYFHHDFIEQQVTKRSSSPTSPYWNRNKRFHDHFKITHLIWRETLLRWTNNSAKEAHSCMHAKWNFNKIVWWLKELVKRKLLYTFLPLKWGQLKLRWKVKVLVTAESYLRIHLSCQCRGDCLFTVAQNNAKKQLSAWVVKAGN